MIDDVRITKDRVILTADQELVEVLLPLVPEAGLSYIDLVKLDIGATLKFWAIANASGMTLSQWHKFEDMCHVMLKIALEKEKEKKSPYHKFDLYNELTSRCSVRDLRNMEYTRLLKLVDVAYLADLAVQQ